MKKLPPGPPQKLLINHERFDFPGLALFHSIENWFAATYPKKAGAMWIAIKENENLRRLARNPLMIAIIAIIYEEDRELPQRRAALYQRAVEVLLSKWDKAKKLMNRFAPEKKEFFLRKLAFEGHCSNRRTVSAEKARGLFCRLAPQLGLADADFDGFMAEICQRSYLLREMAAGFYDFLHLSFQEYFTALELAKQADGIGIVILHLNEPWWEEPIRLYAGLGQDTGAMIRRIREEVPEDLFYGNLLLAGKCAADAEFMEPGLKAEIVAQLWNLYRKGEYWSLMKKAGKVLSLLKPPGIIATLVEQLNDENKEKRREAVIALGAIGGVGALPALLLALEKDTDEYVRGSAAEALGQLGNEETLPALLRALEKDKDSEVRWRAAEVLGQLGNAEALPALLRALEKDKESGVRGSAAYALGQWGNAETLPALLRALEKDKNEYVRERAAEALGQLGNIEALPSLLRALEKDLAWQVRGRAADALGQLGSTGSIPVLLRALEKDSDSDVRGRAALALGQLGNSQALPALLRALEKDESSNVRWNAAEALAKIGDDTAIPALRNALEDEWNVRNAAYEALEEISRRMALRIKP